MLLYKYVSANRVDVMERRVIRFTQPGAFNDPFEMQPHFHTLAPKGHLERVIEEEFDGIVRDMYEKLPPEVKRRVSTDVFLQLARTTIPTVRKSANTAALFAAGLLSKNLLPELDKNFGILSLAEQPKNLLMWAHYANAHTGMVVGFDKDHEFFNQKISAKDELRHVRKVKYAKERPSITLAEADDFSVFLTKGLEWEYEQEWRMILPLSDAYEKKEGLPHDIFLFRIPATAIREVIFGARMTKDVKKGAIQRITNSDIRHHVRLFQAKISDSKFELELETLKI